MNRANPFSAGFRAARANLVPGLVIQALMLALVLLYYFEPAARPGFEWLAAAKASGGFAFSFGSAVVAGAVLPTLFKWATMRRAVTRRDLGELAFLSLFWGCDGMFVDAFYRLQGVIFGTRPDVAIVVKKVLVDQLIYNSVFAAPYTIGCFEWRNRGFAKGALRDIVTWHFYGEHVVPTLFATWAVWFPVTSAVYALPPLLQIPLFALALTFWSLLITWITSRPRVQPERAEALSQVVPD